METKKRLQQRIKELEEQIEGLEANLYCEQVERERLFDELAFARQTLWELEERNKSSWDYDDVDNMEGCPYYD